MKNDFDFPPVAEYAKEKYDDWRERHDHQAFSGDWNEMLARKMRDPELDDDLRYLSWLTLYAAGNFSDWPVDPQGNEKFQKDCVKDTGMAKQRVSEAVARCGARGYVLLPDSKGRLPDGTRGPQGRMTQRGYVLLPDSKGRLPDGTRGPQGRMIQPDGRHGLAGVTDVTSKMANKRQKSSGGLGFYGEDKEKTAYQQHREAWLKDHPEKAAERARAEAERAAAQRIIDAIDVEILTDWNRRDQGKKNGTDESGRVGQKVREGCDKKSGQGAENEPDILITSIPLNGRPSSSSLRSSPLTEEEAPSTSTTTTESAFDPTLPLTKTLFHREMQKTFVDAGKPAPSKQQSDQAYAKLQADARGFYVADLRARINGIRHPGVLAIDAATFAESWPRRKQKLEAEWKQRREFAERQAQKQAEAEEHAARVNAEAENYQAACYEWAQMPEAERAVWIEQAKTVLRSDPLWQQRRQRMTNEARERAIEEDAVLLYARAREDKAAGKLKILIAGGD